MSFDVTFAKAMRLLHSPSKDAAEQIKMMLDECVAQKKAPQPVAPRPPPPTVKPVVTARPAPARIAAPVLVPTDDIDNTSLKCVVCKRVDQTSGNEIVECQECHSLYHQECHKPSLANENVRDPRFVWYCSTCTDKRKKSKITGKPPIPQASNSSSTKDSKDHQNPEVSPFKSWSFLKK